MKFEKTRLSGVIIIILNPFTDERGFFMRTYDKNKFEENGIDRVWVQENHSRSDKKDIIRGLHLQLLPFAETKLVRCISGAVLDVFVDLRKGSGTFGNWDSVELSEENKRMVFIPKGFAHGFCTLTEVSEVVYKVDNYYSPEHEFGIIWNDDGIGIEWPVSDPILSEKDKRNSTLKRFIQDYQGIEI